MTKTEQVAIQQRIEGQDRAQEAEEVKQTALLQVMKQHLERALHLKQQAWERVNEIHRKEKLVEVTKKKMRDLRLEYRTKKQVMF